MADTSHNYTPLELQAFAQQIYQGRPLVIVPYGYPLSFTGLTQNSTQTQQLSITANADFILTEIKYHANIGTAQTISNKTAAFVRMLVTDSGTNEQFTNAAVDLENYATNGPNLTGVLPFPRFIGGRTALTVTVTSYAPTAETYALELFFEGILCRTYSA